MLTQVDEFSIENQESEMMNSKNNHSSSVGSLLK